MALEIILRLDIAQEHRQLSEEELQLRKKLKVRVLGLAAVERARKKQVSRITNLKLGDANTKNFHRRANARRRKNYMQKLQNGRGWAVTHDEKVAVAQTHFGEIMGRPPQRSTDLNWDTIDITQHDLRGLDTPFTEEELKNAINQMPSDKAPGPDRFTGAFLKSCRDIIKGDIIAASNSFHSLRCSSLQIINSANIVLLPKKEGAATVTDFQPISLIHSFVKIIAKALALRLALFMNNIVSTQRIKALLSRKEVYMITT